MATPRGDETNLTLEEKETTSVVGCINYLCFNYIFSNMYVDMNGM